MFKRLLKANPNQLLPPFVTVESVAPNNETTSKDESSTCEIVIPKPKLSETLEADSTSSEKGVESYWNAYSEAINSKLWLPMGIVSPDSALISYDILSSKTVVNSWFSTIQVIAPKEISRMISLQSWRSFLAECTDSAVTVTKSKRIRVYPDREQRALLRKWFGVARYVFNRTVEYLKQPDTQANWKAIKTGILNDLPDWAKPVPYQIKSVAIRDACEAVKAAKRKYGKTGQIQRVKFRSRKDKVANAFIPATAVTRKGIYHTVLGVLKMAELLPDAPKDSRIIQDGSHFYLCVPHSVTVSQREPSGSMVALDPGVRTFLTYFAETGFGWLGYHAIGKIQRLCYHLDDLLSRADKAERPKRRNMRRAANRLRKRIQYLVDELHHKIARFLVDAFDIILLPTFETQNMAQRGKRRLRKKTARQMLTLSHYRFKQFLKQKAKETGAIVIDVCEAYTSKTVSWTGEIVNNLGGKKIIKDSVGNCMDRDLNGARGIFLRALGDSPELQKLCSFANRA